MPKRAAMRDAIRNTWLNSQYWKFTKNNDQNVIIHPIFLLGTQNGFNLSREAAENNDILQYDFIESHYNLTVKEMNFKKYRTSIFYFVFFSFCGFMHDYGHGPIVTYFLNGKKVIK